MRSSIAAAVAALAPVVLAGTATVQNNCAFPVYIWPTDSDRHPSSPQTIAPGASYSEAYRTPTSGGVSLKLAKTPAGIANPTQLEYTMSSFGGGLIFYDGSQVDCTDSASGTCPFFSDGMHLVMSDSSCPQRTCTPGQTCTGFYQYFNDDVNTLSCNPSSNLSLTICTAAASSAASSSSSGSSSSGASSGSSASSGGASGSGSSAAEGAASAAASAAAQPIAAAAAVAPSAAPIYNEALHSGQAISRVKRHIHNHMRRHGH